MQTLCVEEQYKKKTSTYVSSVLLYNVGSKLQLALYFGELIGLHMLRLLFIYTYKFFKMRIVI